MPILSEGFSSVLAQSAVALILHFRLGGLRARYELIGKCCIEECLRRYCLPEAILRCGGGRSTILARVRCRMRNWRDNQSVHAIPENRKRASLCSRFERSAFSGAAVA